MESITHGMQLSYEKHGTTLPLVLSMSVCSGRLGGQEEGGIAGGALLKNLDWDTVKLADLGGRAFGILSSV